MSIFATLVHVWFRAVEEGWTGLGTSQENSTGTKPRVQTPAKDSKGQVSIEEYVSRRMRREMTPNGVQGRYAHNRVIRWKKAHHETPARTPRVKQNAHAPQRRQPNYKHPIVRA